MRPPFCERERRGTPTFRESFVRILQSRCALFDWRCLADRSSLAMPRSCLIWSCERLSATEGFGALRTPCAATKAVEQLDRSTYIRPMHVRIVWLITHCIYCSILEFVSTVANCDALIPAPLGYALLRDVVVDCTLRVTERSAVVVLQRAASGVR